MVDPDTLDDQEACWAPHDPGALAPSVLTVPETEKATQPVQPLPPVPGPEGGERPTPSPPEPVLHLMTSPELGAGEAPSRNDYTRQAADAGNDPAASDPAPSTPQEQGGAPTVPTCPAGTVPRHQTAEERPGGVAGEPLAAPLAACPAGTVPRHQTEANGPEQPGHAAHEPGGTAASSPRSRSAADADRPSPGRLGMHHFRLPR